MSHIIPGDPRPDSRCFYKVKDHFVASDKKRTWTPEPTFDPVRPDANAGHRSLGPDKVRSRRVGAERSNITGCAMQCDATLPAGGRRRIAHRGSSVDLSERGANGNDGWSTPGSRCGSVGRRAYNGAAPTTPGQPRLDQKLLSSFRSPSPNHATQTKWITNWLSAENNPGCSPRVTTQPWCLDTEYVLDPDFRPQRNASVARDGRRGTGGAASLRSNSRGTARERNVMTGHGVARAEYMKESKKRCTGAGRELDSAWGVLRDSPVEGIRRVPNAASDAASRYAPSEWLSQGMKGDTSRAVRRRSLVAGGKPPAPQSPRPRAHSVGPFPQQPKSKCKNLNPDESPRIAGQRRKTDPAPKKGPNYRPYGVTRDAKDGKAVQDMPLSKPAYISSTMNHVVSKRSLSSKGRVRTRCAMYGVGRAVHCAQLAMSGQPWGTHCEGVQSHAMLCKN